MPLQQPYKWFSSRVMVEPSMKVKNINVQLPFLFCILVFDFREHISSLFFQTNKNQGCTSFGSDSIDDFFIIDSSRRGCLKIIVIPLSQKPIIFFSITAVHRVSCLNALFVDIDSTVFCIAPCFDIFSRFEKCKIRQLLSCEEKG